MTIEINDNNRQALVTSIQRYFQQNMDEPIGNLAAGALLSFFIEELGPLVYNKAVADVQGRLQARIAEIDLEVYEDEFQYWSKHGGKKKAKAWRCAMPVIRTAVAAARWRWQSACRRSCRRSP